MSLIYPQRNIKNSQSLEMSITSLHTYFGKKNLSFISERMSSEDETNYSKTRNKVLVICGNGHLGTCSKYIVYIEEGKDRVINELKIAKEP